QVDLAVVVEVAKGDAARQVRLLEIGAAALRDLLELAGLVAQQHGSLAAGGAGRIADGVAVGDEQVFPAVMIEVEKAGAPADILLADGGDAGGFGVEREE